MLILISYGFLYLTVMSLWLPSKPGLQIWQALLGLSVLLGLISQQVLPIALAPLLALSAALYYDQTKKTNNVFAVFLFLFISAISVGLVANWFPGFAQFKIFDQALISQNAVPFTLCLNYNASLVGILLLGISRSVLVDRKEWTTLFKKTLPWMAMTVFVLIALAITFKLVKFDPKLPPGLFIWGLTNLLFVCTTEEAFFRGFVQKKFSSALKKIRYGDYISILVASLLFGLAHFMGGIKYVLLATIAGVLYGWIYHKTQHIESSIIVHFTLNVTHFLFFTYPMLAAALI